MHNIAIIMSTYNGQEFVRTQIDSILNQKDVELTLFVRDDGSKDATPEILQEYEAKHENVIFVNKDHIENLGVLNSFMTLLEKVVKEHPEFEYFSFADQDDFWMEDKLSAAITMIEEQNESSNHPAMYYSNKIFVDRELKTISEEHIPVYNDFLEVAFICRAQGCTQVLNRAMAEMAISPIPKNQPYHDSYVFRLAKSIGATIVFDKTPHMLYRQHNNVFGMKVLEKTNLKWSSVKKLFSRKKVKAAKQKASHWIGDVMTEIQELHEPDLCETGRQYIGWLTSYYKNFGSFMHLAFCKPARNRGLKGWCFWIWSLMIGGI